MSLDVPTEPALVQVTRNGSVESVHLGHVVVSGPDGPPLAIAGDPGALVYPRSALKPLQAVAVLERLAGLGITMDPAQVAMTGASHDGSDLHQLLAAEILAQAGLDERALQCPAAWPADLSVRSQLTQATRLSHNCSGKHAAMLWAHTATGADPRSYLAPTSDLQQHIASVLERIVAEPVLGPGVDGCGAPAWRCSLAGMAQGFARLVAGYEPGLTVVRDAMMQLPHLVGGMHLADTQMMLSDGRVVAKRGAEGVMVAAFDHPCHGPLGMAVKVLDGSDRAAGPLAAGILHALGAAVDDATRRPPVLGGSAVVGTIQATPQALEATSLALSHLSGRPR